MAPNSMPLGDAANEADGVPGLRTMRSLDEGPGVQTLNCVLLTSVRQRCTVSVIMLQTPKTKVQKTDPEHAAKTYKNHLSVNMNLANYKQITASESS